MGEQHSTTRLWGLGGQPAGAERGWLLRRLGPSLLTANGAPAGPRGAKHLRGQGKVTAKPHPNMHSACPRVWARAGQEGSGSAHNTMLATSLLQTAAVGLLTWAPGEQGRASVLPALYTDILGLWCTISSETPTTPYINPRRQSTTPEPKPRNQTTGDSKESIRHNRKLYCPHHSTEAGSLQYAVVPG